MKFRGMRFLYCESVLWISQFMIAARARLVNFVNAFILITASMMAVFKNSAVVDRVVVNLPVNQ